MNAQDDELLHGGLDGELDAAGRAALSARLANDAEFRATWEVQTALRTAIRDGVAAFEAPTRLHQRLCQKLQQALQVGDANDSVDADSLGTPPPAPERIGAMTSTAPQRAAAMKLTTTQRAAAMTSTAPQLATALPPRRLWLMLVASAVASSGMTVIALNALRSQSSPTLPNDIDVADLAVSAHATALVAGRPIEVASSDQHTVRPWLSAHLGFAPAVPDLSVQGFELVGARRDRLAGSDAAVLVYRRRLHVVSVFVQPASSTGVRQTKVIRGFNVLSSTHGDLRLWVVSDLNAAELGQFASLMVPPG